MQTTGYTALLPLIDLYRPLVRHVDLSMRGDYRVPITWTLKEVPVNWLSRIPTNSTFNQNQMDQRLNIAIYWSRVPKSYNDLANVGITLHLVWYLYFDLLRILVVNHQALSDFTSFPEIAGMILVKGPHFQ